MDVARETLIRPVKANMINARPPLRRQTNSFFDDSAVNESHSISRTMTTLVLYSTRTFGWLLSWAALVLVVVNLECLKQGNALGKDWLSRGIDFLVQFSQIGRSLG